MNIEKIIGFGIGPIASAVIGLLVVPLTSWLFSPEDIGRLNLLQLALSFSLILSVMGLDQAYVREFHTSKDRPLLLKACFAPGFWLLCIGALATIPFASELARWWYGKDDYLFYIITLICMILNYVSRFLSLILRMQERGLAFSMSQILPKIVQLILLAAVVSVGLQRSFLTMMWITMASTAAVLIAYSWNTREQWRPATIARPSREQVTILLKFGLPLVFSGLAYWALSASSILVLRANSSFAEMGIYAVTSSIAGAVAIFQTIFTTIWAPSWQRDPHLGRFFVRRCLRIFPALVVVVVLSVLVLGPALTSLTWMEYWQAEGTWRYLKTLLLNNQKGLPGVFVHNPLPEAVNGSLWSLGPEFLAYLILAAVGRIFLKMNRDVAVIGLLLVMLGLLAWYVGEHRISKPHLEVVVLFGWGVCWLHWRWQRQHGMSFSRWGCVTVALGLLLCLLLVDGLNRLVFATFLTVLLAWLSWHGVEKLALRLKPVAPLSDG